MKNLNKKKKTSEDDKTAFEKTAKELYIKVSDTSELRVLIFDDVHKPLEDIDILFIPGLFTIFPRWEKVVQELSESYIVYYVETRDKNTSRLVKKAKFDAPRLAKDLANIVFHLKLNDRKFITISSSMGGMVVLENLANNSVRSAGDILISPGVEMPFPKWVVLLLRVIPPFVIILMKPFTRWLIGNVYVNKKKEPLQSQAYQRSIGEADPKKLRKSVLNLAKYSGWDILPKIKNRVILIGATHDKVHASQLSYKIASNLVNCSFVDLETNKAAHDTPLVDLTKKFMKELTGTGQRIPNEEFHHLE